MLKADENQPFFVHLWFKDILLTEKSDIFRNFV
jgi:hypothetical protein